MGRFKARLAKWVRRHGLEAKRLKSAARGVPVRHPVEGARRGTLSNRTGQTLFLSKTRLSFGFEQDLRRGIILRGTGLVTSENLCSAKFCEAKISLN